MVGDVLLLCKHLVANGTHLEANLGLPLLLQQHRSQDYAYAVAYPACITQFPVTEQLQQQLDIVHLVEVDTGILFAHVELGCEPCGRDTAGGGTSVGTIHMSSQLE